MADYNTKTKYYFYKLYNDFFDLDVIDYLKGTDKGSKTIVIYFSAFLVLVAVAVIMNGIMNGFNFNLLNISLNVYLLVS